MFQKFRNVFSVSDEKWTDYTSRLQRLEVPAKTVLLKEGEVSKKLYLIEKGCLRVWFNNNGRDLTVQFFFENGSVSSLESFRKGLPSLVNIETVEPSVVWWAHKKDVDEMLAELSEIPSLRAKLIDALFERTFDYMKHFLSFIKDTPQQRYLHLLKEKPQLISRIPQHYIASYLGISTVHLSRIKSSIARKRSAA